MQVLLSFLIFAFSSSVVLANNASLTGKDLEEFMDLNKKRASYFSAIYSDKKIDKSAKQLAIESYGTKERDKLFSIYLERYRSGKMQYGFILAMIYLEGGIDGGHSGDVVTWLRKAIPTKNGDAEAILGILYDNGHLVSQDGDQALEYFQQGWAKKSPIAGYHLARRLYLASQEDNKETVVEMLATARNEHIERYMLGSGMTEDPISGAIYGRLIRELLGPIAFNLAADYARENGVQPDLEKAAQFYAYAAHAGLQRAHLALAYMYKHGDGLEKDEDRAAERFKAAASCYPWFLERPEPFNYELELCQAADKEFAQIADRQRANEASIWPILGMIGLAILASSNGGGDVSSYYEPYEVDMSIPIDVQDAWLP
ncbi:MAG: hypothetical protein AAGA21_00585 [Pseudomonadota bacterium]